MRQLIAGICVVCATMSPVAAQVSVGIATPGVSIGINLPVYPQLVAVPGYPVYYAPRLPANFFFYDGAYWVYQGDEWYMSGWYNGPWSRVSPMYVPPYILRVPVRYYRVPPPYFRPWRADAPPRWGERWGDDWHRHRKGWDHWNRAAVPAPAPLPVYQRQYSGDRYPQQPERQQALREQNYRYQPREPVARREDPAQATPAPARREPQAARPNPGNAPPNKGTPAPASQNQGKGRDRGDERGPPGKPQH